MQYNNSQDELSAFMKHKAKIIEDDDVHIADMDSEDDNDVMSISSSEDVEIIKSLSHWANKDILSNEASSNSQSIDAINKDKQIELYDLSRMLRTILISDICDNGKPGSDPIKYNKNGKPHPPLNMSIRSYVVRELIKNNDVKTLRLHNVTPFGLNTLIPELAELYQIQYFAETKPNYYSEDKSDTIVVVDLVKTDSTSKPSYNKRKNLRLKFVEKHDLTLKKASSHRRGNQGGQQQQRKKQRSQKQRIRQIIQPPHLTEVASDSAPIASSNLGHRMLAAMGWKEGEGIGASSSEGIKEPIKVYMRARGRGLGA
ncbi:MAG: hypothetical protein EXX96DRAFT_545301 [Benjaminiella poitrasii]|nr:MAG: hypothetical protein EXX96DRAFT_545301 [Benjaminiella poitrasii]